MQQLRYELNGDRLGIAKHCASSAQANICVVVNTSDSVVISASTVLTFLLTIVILAIISLLVVLL